MKKHLGALISRSLDNQGAVGQGIDRQIPSRLGEECSWASFPEVRGRESRQRLKREVRTGKGMLVAISGWKDLSRGLTGDQDTNGRDDGSLWEE